LSNGAITLTSNALEWFGDSCAQSDTAGDSLLFRQLALHSKTTSANGKWIRNISISLPNGASPIDAIQVINVDGDAEVAAEWSWRGNVRVTSKSCHTQSFVITCC
jgi:hypothetical protein